MSPLASPLGAALPSTVYRATLCYLEHAAQHLVLRDAPQVEVYDEIYAETLCVHPDTYELGYIARRGQSEVVVHNLHASMSYDVVWRDSLRFAPDGSALFYLAERDNETVLVVNGVEERVFQMVLEAHPFQPTASGTAPGLHVIAVMGNALQSLYLFPKDSEKQATLWNL